MELLSATDLQFSFTPVREAWLGNTLVWFKYWTGLGSNNNWSTAANWGNKKTPVAPSLLEFAGTTRLSAFNDFPIDTTFNGITFNASSGMFQLTGNKFVLGTQGIANNSINNQTINNTIGLSLGSKTIDCSSGPITFTGVLSGTGSIVKNGSQTLTYTGACNYTGQTIINQGTLAITGASVLNGVISGAGSLRKSGSFAVTIGGDNTYTGGTTFSLGTITYASGNAFGTGLFTAETATQIITPNNVTLPNNFQINAGATMQYRTAGANTITVTGNIAGSGNLNKTGNGTLDLTASTLTYIGSTTITSGYIRAIKTNGASTATAAFQTSSSVGISLVVSFNVSPPTGVTTFRFFQGSTVQSFSPVTLVGLPSGSTATYNSATSTLSVTIP